MFHLYNKTTSNQSFDAGTVNNVWNKGAVVPNQDPAIWRKDSCGAFIKRSDYGDCNSQFGWEIDHIQPVAHDGSDYLFNLQPLQWANNRHKSDNWPKWECKMKAVA
jgi:hypothetical protein